MDAAQSSHQRIQTFSLLTLAAIALGAALHWLSPVMVPFVLAFFLTVVLTPVVEVLHRRLKMPVLLALFLTGLLGLAGVIGIGALVAQSLEELSENTDEYVASFGELQEQLAHPLAMFGIGVAEPAAETEAETEAEFEQDEASAEGETDDDIDPLETAPSQGDATLVDESDSVPAEEASWSNLVTEGDVQALFAGVANTLGNILSQGVLVMIFMMFLVSGRAHSGTLGDVEERLKGYVVTKAVVSSITGVLTWLILSMLGIEMALLFGLLAFLLNFIPSIGSVIATLLPLPIILLGDYDMAQRIAAIALPGAVQFGVGNLLEPRMLGDSMDLHPVTILLALIFWGMIWGFVGTLLATPVTAVVRILLQKLPETRPLAELMAGRMPDESPAAADGAPGG